MKRTKTIRVALLTLALLLARPLGGYSQMIVDSFIEALTQGSELGVLAERALEQLEVSKEMMEKLTKLQEKFEKVQEKAEQAQRLSMNIFEIKEAWTDYYDLMEHYKNTINQIKNLQGDFPEALQKSTDILRLVNSGIQEVMSDAELLTHFTENAFELVNQDPQVVKDLVAKVKAKIKANKAKTQGAAEVLEMEIARYEMQALTAKFVEFGTTGLEVSDPEILKALDSSPLYIKVRKDQHKTVFGRVIGFVELAMMLLFALALVFAFAKMATAGAGSLNTQVGQLYVRLLVGFIGLFIVLEIVKEIVK